MYKGSKTDPKSDEYIFACIFLLIFIIWLLTVTFALKLTKEEENGISKNNKSLSSSRDDRDVQKGLRD